MYRSDSLKQEFDHFKEGIARLFGTAELLGDVSLERGKRNIFCTSNTTKYDSVQSNYFISHSLVLLNNYKGENKTNSD